MRFEVVTGVLAKAVASGSNYPIFEQLKAHKTFYLPVDTPKQGLGYSNRYRDWATVCKPMDLGLTSSRNKSFSLFQIFQTDSRADKFSIQWVFRGFFAAGK